MKKPCRKMNTLFLIMVVFYLLITVAFSMLAQRMMEPPVVISLVMGELIVLIPGIIFLLLFHCDLAEWIPIKKVRGSTIGFTFLLTFLMQPVLYFLNVLSQLAEKNVALDLFSKVEDVPGIVLILVIGLLGPFCEEVVFRGILFSGFRRSGRIFGAIVWTAFLFGLFHMNLNQFGYAMMIGLVCAFLVEVTGSLVPALIVHVLINSYNVLQILLMEAAEKILGEGLSDLTQAEELITTDLLLRMAGLLLIPAVICTVLGAVVMIAIAKQEGTREHLMSILPFRKKSGEEPETEKKEPVVTVTGLIGVAICIFMIFLLETVMQMVL